MRTLIAFCFVCTILMTNCKKDDLEYTGTLEMTFKIANSADYSNITISIYTMDDLRYSLYEDHPGNNGIYSRRLLPGNYRVSIYYHGNRANPTFQIINGETTSFDYYF